MSLSGELKPVGAIEAATELLTCCVGGQWLGFPVSQVREVVMPQQCTLMPKAASAVIGLINLRGRVITLLDVRKVVGLSEQEVAKHRIVIVETMSGEDFGLVMDEVGEVSSLNPDLYEKTPGTLGAAWFAISDGVLKQSERVVVLLDVERLVAMTLPASEQGQHVLHRTAGRDK